MTELITGTGLFGSYPLDVGSRIESYHSGGDRKVLRVVSIDSRTAATVCSWRWYDWMRWRSVKWIVRRLFTRLKARF